MILSPARVAGLVAEQMPALAGETVRAVPGAGTINSVFRIGTRAAARFPHTPEASADTLESLRQEAARADSFAEVAGVPAPRVLHVGTPVDDYPGYWTVQTWVEGRVATPTGEADSLALAGDLAGLITRLRGVDVGTGTFDGRGRGGDLKDHDAWVAECLERSEGLLDTRALGRLWAGLRTLPSLPGLAMCHKDLIPGNLLLRGGRLAGVLDAGDFGPADPALDLVCAWHLFDEEARGVLQRGVGAGPLEWARGAAWAFQQAIGLVWYYRESNPAMSDLGRTALARVLEAQGSLISGGTP